MPRADLTPRMRECLIVLQELVDANHRAPSVREIAAALKVTGLSEIDRLLTGLADRGYITRAKFQKRSIVIVKRIDPTEAA